MILAASLPARQKRWPNGHSNTPTGLEVFPVDPDTKAPIGATEGANGETIWMATKGHRPPPATRNHRRMVATATRRPNRRPHTQNVVVLDIDPRHDGHDTWDTIVAGHDLPVTRRHASGRNDGGFHIWFRNPNGHRTQGP